MTLATNFERSLDALMSTMRDDEERDYTYLHPSEIGNCPRVNWYKTMGVTPLSPHSPIKMRIFSNGHFVHLRYQLYLRDAGLLARDRVAAIEQQSVKIGLSESERMVVSGQTGRTYMYGPSEWIWLASEPDGDGPKVGGMRLPHQVKACDLKVDDEMWMVEVPLVDMEHHLGGHADAVVRTPDGGAAVVDFKGTNEYSFGYLFWDKTRQDEYERRYPDKHFAVCHICGATMGRWKDLSEHLKAEHREYVAIDSKHRIQLNAYMWMLNLDTGLLVHENKNSQLLICEPVPRDETLVTQIKADAKELWDAILSEEIPERPYKSRRDFPCPYCDFASQCWS